MPQAFKGSLSAHEAARAMARGCRAALPQAEAVALPMADGGDDTGVGHGDDDVGVDGCFSGELASQRDARRMNVARKHGAIGTREVDELEDAL